MTFSSPIDDSRRRHPSVVVEPLEAFAHPSERLFAKLLNLYGYEWRYEPIEFPLDWDDGGTPRRGFRPDFYLIRERLFIELTVLDQRLVTRKNQKIRRFRSLYPEVALQVVYQRDFFSLVRRHDLSPRNDHAA